MRMNNKYLVDKELDFEIEDDLLGTSIYVEQLQKLIKDCGETPYTETIGLVGDWGVGKSSIVNTLKNRMVNEKINNSRISFISYNAWKYNKDSFRKQFLINSIEDDKIKRDLVDELYTQISKTRITLNKKINIQHFAFTIIIVLFILTLVLNYTNWFSSNDSIQAIIDGIIDIASIGIVALLAEVIFKNIAVEEQVSEIKDFSPNEFSNKFRKNIAKNNHFSVFVIDDIDRCDSIQTIEILDTIKSYLKTECGNYIFLIPIDKKRLYKILEKDKGYDYYECENYYSKIFDLTIEVKEPGQVNLFDMIVKESEKIDLGLSAQSISLLTDFLIKTPRDVKTHLNNLKNVFITLNKQVELKYTSIKDVETIKDEVIKIYIIEKRWPNAYSYAKENYVKADLDTYKTYREAGINCNELEMFLKQANHTKIESIGAYVYLKEDISNLDRQYVSAIISGDIEEIQKEFEVSKFISHFDYAYKVYVLKRNLIHSRFPLLLKVYFYYLNSFDNISYFDNGQITIKSIENLFITTNFKINEQQVFVNEMIEFSKNKNCDLKFIKIYEHLLNGLIVNALYKEALVIMINLQHLLDKGFVLNGILNIISKDTDAANNTDYFKVFKIFGISEFSEILKAAIDNKKKIIILQYLKAVSSCSDINAEEILNEISIYNKIGSSYTNWQREKIENDYLELSIINELLTKVSENVLGKFKTKTSVNYASNALSYVKNNFSNENLYKPLLKELILYCHQVDSLFNNKNSLVDALNYLDINKDKDLIDYLFNLDVDTKKKNELFIFILNKSSYKILIDEYIQFLNKHGEEEYLNIWIQTIKQKNSIYFSFKHISNSTQTNYSQFMNILYPRLLELKYDLSTLIYSNSSFDQFSKNEQCWLKVKDLKATDKRRDIVIQKIVSFEDYLKCLETTNKRSHRNLYEKAFKQIIDKIRNVDELLKIHDYLSDTDILDKKDLAIIKEKVLKDYPNEKERFTKISWMNN